MPEEKFRNKISWMMFLLSLFVIWVHSYNIALFAGPEPYKGIWAAADRIEMTVSVAVGQTAVPGFFLLSSYLFFRTYSPRSLARKWKERAFSVALPYLFWNSLYYMGYVTATRLPLVRDLVGKAPVPFSVGEYLNAILHYSYAPVFWYLYQLILLILLSPVIYLLVKNRIAGILWLSLLLLAVHFRWDTQHPNTDALAYYSAAAWLAVHGKKTVEAAWNRKREIAGGLLIGLAAVCFFQSQDPAESVLWTVLYRAAVPAALWLLLPEERLIPARPWMKMSLYLYAIHYVIVRFVNKGGAAAVLRMTEMEGARCLAALGIYFLLPAAVLLAAYGSAKILGRYAPALWRALSGGRSLK